MKATAKTIRIITLEMTVEQATHLERYIRLTCIDPGFKNCDEVNEVAKKTQHILKFILDSEP